MEIMKTCNANCNECKKLNIKVDDKGYPYGYECMKYGNSVFQEKFKDTKEFSDFSTRWKIVKIKKDIKSEQQDKLI